ncbi:MAG: prephenate dehydrogenase [Candidatus Omnitrophota bacterium]
MKFKKIAIIGMGLIGGSVGKALIKKSIAKEVAGICRREVSLEKARKEGALTEGYVNDYARALLGAEIIIIATPVHTIKEVLEELGNTLKDKGVLVTDAGSTKKEIVKFAEKFKEKFSFIGSHPLAGSEKTGVENSSENLFGGSVCVLTPDGTVDAKHERSLSGLWEALGARVILMTPEEHDKNLAVSSHLPHVAAFALAGMLKENINKEVFATGFKDTTRIASSDPKIWSDIFATNSGNVLEAIKKYKAILSEIEENIKKNDTEKLRKKLEVYKRLRDELV